MSRYDELNEQELRALVIAKIDATARWFTYGDARMCRFNDRDHQELRDTLAEVAEIADHLNAKFNASTSNVVGVNLAMRQSAQVGLNR